MHCYSVGAPQLSHPILCILIALRGMWETEDVSDCIFCAGLLHKVSSTLTTIL